MRTIRNSNALNDYALTMSHTHLSIWSWSIINWQPVVFLNVHPNYRPSVAKVHQNRKNKYLFFVLIKCKVAFQQKISKFWFFGNRDFLRFEENRNDLVPWYIFTLFVARRSLWVILRTYNYITFFTYTGSTRWKNE